MSDYDFDAELAKLTKADIDAMFSKDAPEPDYPSDIPYVDVEDQIKALTIIFDEHNRKRGKMSMADGLRKIENANIPDSILRLINGK